MENYSLHQPLSAGRKLRLALVGLVLIIGCGTIGFITLEGMSFVDALYMTVITLSTVGFAEVGGELDTQGRVFVIMLIVVGVALAGALATIVGQLALEGHFRHLVVRRKMETKISRMNNHFIIAGYGRVGRQVASDFAKKGVPFVIIERDNEDYAKLVSDGNSGLQGDATEDAVLHLAGIDRAHTLISTLPDEAQNVYLTLTARFIKADLKIIARADFEEGEKKLMRAGANHVVIPHVIGGVRMAKAALQPNVVDFMQMTSVGEEGLMIEEMVVPVDCELDGKTLAESGLKQDYGVTIIGVKQRGKRMTINPAASTRLQANDVLVLIGHAENLERLSQRIES